MNLWLNTPQNINDWQQKYLIRCTKNLQEKTKKFLLRKEKLEKEKENQKRILLKS